MILYPNYLLISKPSDMKKIIISMALVILYFQLSAYDSIQPVYLNVVAPSGLKLRATPNLSGEVLYIIPSKSVVSLVENEQFPPKEDEVNYIKGSWVYINYEGEEGYVFDGFLSSLPVPIHEFELTQYDLDLIYPLESWMEYHNPGLSAIDTFGSQLFTKIVTSYDNGNKMMQKNTHSQYILRIEFKDARIWDVYHLLVGMLSSKEELTTFQNNALFISSRAGDIDKIRVDLQEPIAITQEANGMISLEISSTSKACNVDLTRL